MLILGMFIGTGLCILTLLIIGYVLESSSRKKIDEKHGSWEDAVHSVLKDAELLGSVKYRFTVVDKITKQQLELLSHTEKPSVSASHSRYKNDIYVQLKELEEQKMDIFKSILDDGVDPVVSMVDQETGEQRPVKMSEAVAIYNQKTEQTEHNTETISPRAKESHLKIVEDEEKDNESTNPSNPTLH